MSENDNLKHQAVEDSPDLPVHEPLTSGLLLLCTLSFIILVGLFCLGEGDQILKQMLLSDVYLSPKNFSHFPAKKPAQSYLKKCCKAAPFPYLGIRRR